MTAPARPSAHRRGLCPPIRSWRHRGPYTRGQDRPRAAVWIWAHCTLCWLSGRQHTQDLLWEATRTGSSWLGTALRLPSLKALRKRQRGAWYHINRGEPGITIWGTWGTRMGTVSVFYYPVEGYWHLEGEDQAHQSISNM